MDASKRAIVDSLCDKVFETIERSEHLVSLVPASRLAWHPELPAGVPQGNDLGHLLGHLLDCLSGFCAAFHAAFPTELADFLELRSISADQFSPPEEARGKSKLYAGHIERGFRICTDEDLPRKIQTVFVPEGETLMTILLGNLEHLINHQYQLFFYLKLAGLPVTSRDIYALRGPARSGQLREG